MLIFIVFFVTYFTFGSCALVELHNPCASSFDCSAGAICQAKLCQCPPIYIAAASGCVHAPVPIASRPYPAVAYNAYRHPHPMFVQQVALPSAPAAPTFTHQNLLWSAAIHAQAASGAVVANPPPAPTAETPTPPPAPTPTPIIVPQPQPQPQPQESPFTYTLTEYGYQFAVPGASCLQKQLCLGNSVCSLGSCVCPTSYAINGRLCVLTLNTATPPPTPSGNETVDPTASTPAPVTAPPVPVPVPAVVPETLVESLKSTNDAGHASKMIELKATPWFNYVPLASVQLAAPLVAAAPATAVVQAAPVAAVFSAAAANPCGYSNTIIIKELCQQVYSVHGYVPQPQSVIQPDPRAYLSSKASVEAHAAQLWSKILSHPLYGTAVLDYKPHPYISSEYTRYGVVQPFLKQKRT